MVANHKTVLWKRTGFLVDLLAGLLLVFVYGIGPAIWLVRKTLDFCRTWPSFTFWLLMWIFLFLSVGISQKVCVKLYGRDELSEFP